MHLYDLAPLDELGWLLANGYIRETLHPSEPLRIINYTDRAQTKPELFEQFEALQYCRGLIWNTTDGTIVARPFRKFWNYGQAQAAEIRPDDLVQVHDKVDGSLGIIYRGPQSGKLYVATRGSFMSDQAVHAGNLLRDQYGDFARTWAKYGAEHTTLLTEIVYPGNRIVLDYGQRDELVLLGSVGIEDGVVSGPSTAWGDVGWPGPVADTLFGGKFADALKQPLNRPNAEGYVIRVVKRGAPERRGNMVKLKQEDYVRLHKIIFGLTEKSVWRAIVAGDPLEKVLEPLPDEFHAWVTQVYRRIKGEAIERADRVRVTYCKIMDDFTWPEGEGPEANRESRKQFAQIVKDDPDAWAYFMLWNGRGNEIEQVIIQKHLEPVGVVGPSSSTEEVCAELQAGSRCPGCMGCPREED